MKLGNKVTFQTDYIKTGDSFDRQFIEAFPDDAEHAEAFANGYTLKKLEARQHEKPKVGIVVAKRTFTLETRFDYIEDGGEFGSGDWFWHPTIGKREPFYLVATTLNKMYKVKPEDLELFMIEEPIQGLMDE